MAKLKGKGSVLQQTISSVLTDIAQSTGISLDGEENETFDSTTLDGAVYKTYDATGYTEPGTVKLDIFFDPALAGHAAIVALLPAPAACVWKLKYTDSGPSSLTYTTNGIGVSQVIATNDGEIGRAHV